MANLPYVFGFSLVSSIRDMWNAKVYALALLVALFSGLWPYAKLGTMLFCWFAPAKWLSAGRRLWTLEFLDNWGKWSLIDAFVMVLFMVAFRFSLSAKDLTMMPVLPALFSEAETSFELNIWVEAGLGFYMFLIATVGSLVVGHGMTACNRHALCLGEYSEPALNPTDHSLKRLCNTLRPPGYWSGKLFVYGPIAAVSAALLLVVVGVWIDVFAFTFEGLGGYTLGDKNVRSFSIISLGFAIPDSVKHPGAGTFFIQAVFLLFAAFVVIAYFCILLCLWCAPLTPRLQTHFYVASQILEAWNGIDVFVISILASVLEISQFVVFIIGDKCDGINKILPKLPFHLPGSETCFQITTELRSGFYILLIAAIVSSVTGRVMMSRCKSALQMDVAHVDSFVSHASLIVGVDDATPFGRDAARSD